MYEGQPTLQELGWNHFFQQQLSIEEWQATEPVRVFALNRHLVDGVGACGRRQFSLPTAWLDFPVEALPTVGDWILVDEAGL